jgi:excisionase family DNA binding protein
MSSVSLRGGTFSQLLTAGEVAEVLRITPRQAYRLVAIGELPGVHIGQASVRVDAADLTAYIEQRRGGSP